MGEKHLPAAESGDRQRGRGMKGERTRGKGNERVGGGMEVKGHCWLGGRGKKLQIPDIGFIPVFQTLEPAV